jgi:hypothetical protein
MLRRFLAPSLILPVYGILIILLSLSFCISNIQITIQRHTPFAIPQTAFGCGSTRSRTVRLAAPTFPWTLLCQTAAAAPKA